MSVRGERSAWRGWRPGPSGQGRGALYSIFAAWAALAWIPLEGAEAPGPPPKGRARAEVKRPPGFPHRIWAACDFEGQTPDYAWFGEPETREVPRYPGNATALRAAPRPYRDHSARMVGANPVPGPRMGKTNHLYCRYFLRGATEAIFQHFSLTREDNWHIRVSGLEEGRWAEVALDFSSQAARNDGSAEPFVDGERMDDFKLFVGKPGDGKDYQVLIDDLVFYSLDPALPPDPEPFPNRVISLWAFDTGEKERYWPGDFTISGEREAPPGAHWRSARAVPRRDGRPGKWVRLQIAPPRPVGERTRLRFRYWLRGAREMTVQIFDLTAGDNRHVRLRDLREGEWTPARVDFTRDSRRNDGSSGPFTAGNRVDDLFFFLEGEGDMDLHLDEVVLYDGAPEGEKRP